MPFRHARVYTRLFPTKIAARETEPEGIALALEREVRRYTPPKTWEALGRRARESDFVFLNEYRKAISAMMGSI